MCTRGGLPSKAHALLRFVSFGDAWVALRLPSQALRSLRSELGRCAWQVFLQLHSLRKVLLARATTTMFGRDTMAHEQITNKAALLINPQERSQALHLAGVDITPLVSADQAADYEVAVIAGRNGHGPPPHSHPWDETYFVLHGEIVFGVGYIEKVFEAGALVHVPGGERHWFRFDQPGETVVVTGGHRAFAMFQALADVPEGSPDEEYLAVALRYGEEDRRNR